MWNKINSPIVITIVAITALFVFMAVTKHKLASEIRGAYDELNAIIKDSASDAQKSKAIQKFAQEIGTQIREGFAAASPTQKDDKDSLYTAVKPKITVSGIKQVKSPWQGQEKFIFLVKNNSDYSISNLRLNCEFYKQGELIDCENKWVSEIKILDPNQEIALSQQRSLTKDDPNNSKSDELKVKITSFDLKQIK
jgi:hypothetical protein